MHPTIRPLAAADVDAARAVHTAAFSRGGDAPAPATDDVAARQRRRLLHFLTHDPGGSWVAEVDGRVAGVALALRRDALWGLSLFAVDPAVQGNGIGRQLLEASLRHGEGASRGVIVSSQDPRAIRRYAAAGFDLHPQVEARGEPRRDRLPAADARVRAGSSADAGLADAVDRAVRGAPRGPDHEILCSSWQMFVVDDVDGRGYAYQRPTGELETLAATDEKTATALLWRCLATMSDAGVEAAVWPIGGNQQWAVRIAVTAGLAVTPSGPVFWRGGPPPPCYVPSGPYL